VNQIFDSLAALPGVRVCGLITEDGVPVTLPGKPAEDGREFDIDAIAAIASQWFNEVSRELGAASWASPHTTELTAQHGSLVLMAVPRGVLVCLADRGLAIEEIRLSLSGAAARIQRQLRSMASSSSPVAGNSTTDPAAPLPKQAQDPAGETFAGGGDPGSRAQSS
jgi:predicted regulator of Ras-like GTPase activity (Roadblock/LC7/MglB family)